MQADHRRIRPFILAATLLASLALAASVASAQTLMYTESMGQPFNALCLGVPCGIWNTPLANNAPIDPESKSLVAVLNRYFPGTTNRANFSVSGGVNWWIAPASTPYVKVTITPSKPAIQQVVNQVPIPAGAHPSLGSDHRLAVLQPSTGCTWEFWHMAQAANGSWSAATGGRDCNAFGGVGWYQNVSDAAGNTLEQNTWGGPATGFDSMAGAMLVDELAHGTIPHAVAFALDATGNCYRIWNQPAQRTDGQTVAVLDASGEPTNCVPEGARFRLPPPCPGRTPSTMGICFNLSDLAGDPPIVTELAAAAQKYGLVDENSTSGGLVGVESGDANTPPYLALGGNPYTTPIAGEANTPFLGSYTNQNALALFPWSWLELVQMHTTSSPDPTWYTQSDPPRPIWPS